MQQADDFWSECQDLAAVVAPLRESDFERVTQFKNWTVDDVIGHLHFFNHAAELSLQGEAAFDGFWSSVSRQLKQGASLVETQYGWLDGLSGSALRDAWFGGSQRLAGQFRDTDPKRRLRWAGPEMSARSSVTARQMETWAHGHEIYDVLGLERTETDRIRNIAHLGVTTFGWSFVVRGETPPEPVPHVKLTAPSGANWEWNEPQPDNCVQGSATEFCQVVTQTRNIADTSLKATGDPATRWMAIAQCFAGNPEIPPAPGARHVHV